MQIRVADERLVVAIEDNGTHFAPSAARRERNGLRNMDERLADIGGACRVTATPTKGCRVVFSLPLRPPTLAKNPLAALLGKLLHRGRPSELAE